MRRGLFAQLQRAAGAAGRRMAHSVSRPALKAVESIKKSASSKEASGSATIAETPQQPKAVVAFLPITLVCRDIRYYVNDPSGGTAAGVVKDSADAAIAGKLELLKGLHISAEPGSLTALMGGSGAGACLHVQNWC